MKIGKNRIVAGFFLVLASLIQAFAIENINISLQSSNAILSWPSLTNETYLAQYRHSLASTDAWVTLTNYFPAALDTNVTVFTHSNSVDFGIAPSGGGTNGGGGGIPMPGGTNDYSGPPSTNNGVAGTGFYRVVRDGVHLWGITNGMVVSNLLETTIEFAVDSTDQVVGVTFYDTNTASPITGASAQNVGGNRWLLVWNTLQVFNGDYALCAKLNFASDEPVLSQPVTVTVNNLISFPNYFSTVFGDVMWIYARTFPNAIYEIDLYDENTNYLGSFNDYADGSGTISFLWDLTDGSGNTLDSTNFFGVFTVTNSGYSNISSQPNIHAQADGRKDFLAASPAKKTFSLRAKANVGGITVRANDLNSINAAKQMWVKEGKWTPNDNWVVAYSPLTDPATDPNTAYKESLMVLGGSGGEYTGVIGALDEYGLRGNLSPGNVPQGSAFVLNDTNSRAQLLSYLASPTYENFYFFGHGNDSAIASFNAPATAITSEQVSFALANVPLSVATDPVLINVDPPIMVYPTVNPDIQKVARHPYRFVFLDGCVTGGGLFCESFGIPAITVNTNFFATAGVESRAFVGFTQEKGFSTYTWDSYSLMMGGFFQDWLSGRIDVSHCIGNAQNGVHEAVVNMDTSAIVYGATDMLRNTRTRP